jgi:ribosomal protein S18 acetylase RimI-like enzyme
MISIQPAELKDLKLIRQLAYDIWPFAYGDILSGPQLEYMLDKIYSLASLENQFSVLHHQFIIVRENQAPIAFASFSSHEDNRLIFHLNKIYVQPNQQGKNVGKQILDYVINATKNAGATSLQLNVNRNNKAIDFYKKQGFQIIRKEDIDIGEGFFMNDYVMEKRI